MEKRLESLPTSRPSLLLIAQDIYRDTGPSEEEREEKMEVLKMLSLEELKRYVVTRIYLHQQRFSHSSGTPNTTVAALAAPIATGDGMSATTPETSMPTPMGLPQMLDGAPTPASYHTPGSGASRLLIFQEN